MNQSSFNELPAGLLTYILLTGIICVLWCCSSCPAQKLPIETSPPLDQSNNIRNHLMRVASEVTDNSLVGFNTLDDWQKVRDRRYREYIEMMSLTDVPLQGKRPPLNVKIVGTIQKDGYRIEKLYYESLPNLYVPADLYIPDNITEPVPAVIYVCGHSRTQKVRYQPHPRKFAQLGFVCLIIETIQWGEIRGDHHGCYARGWFHWYSRGYTPGGVELWNAIRGLDLLCQRSEVNAEKLGVTGISGGGAQSWYIAAADPRIKAVAPTCGNSTIEAHIHTRTIDGHCDCMMPINTYLRDYHDIGALIAPRPLMIAQANRDGINTIESVRKTYNYVKDIYDLYDASDNIALVEAPGGHSYHEISRTKIFSFFIKHLMGKDVPPSEVGDVDNSESAQLSQEELKIYIDGPPPDDRTTTIQETFIKIAKPPEIADERQLQAHREDVIRLLHEKTFRAFPVDEVPLDMRLEFRCRSKSGHSEKTFSFVSEKDWRLKVNVHRRCLSEQPTPTMLVLRSYDENRRASKGFISGLNKDWNIAYFETRGIGETSWSPALQWHLRRAAAWTGRTIASMRVYDVLRSLQALRTLPGVQSDRIGIAARGEMCAIALYAALLDGNVSAVVLRDPPPTQNAPSNTDGRGETIEMLNCLRITDLPQVAGLLCPKNIVIIGTMPDSYQWAKDLYDKLKAEHAFQNVKKMSDWATN